MNNFNFTQEFWLVIKDNNKVKKYEVFINVGDWIEKSEIQIDKKTYKTNDIVDSQLKQIFEYKTHIRHSWMNGEDIDWEEAEGMLQALTNSCMEAIGKTILDNNE